MQLNRLATVAGVKVTISGRFRDRCGNFPYEIYRTPEVFETCFQGCPEEWSADRQAVFAATRLAACDYATILPPNGVTLFRFDLDDLRFLTTDHGRAVERQSHHRHQLDGV